MKYKPQNALLEGSTAGMLGALASPSGFSLSTLVEEDVHDAGLAGRAAAARRCGAGALRSAAEYSVVHFAAFVLFGVIASRLLKTNPPNDTQRSSRASFFCTASSSSSF